MPGGCPTTWRTGQPAIDISTYLHIYTYIIYTICTHLQEGHHHQGELAQRQPQLKHHTAQHLQSNNHQNCGLFMAEHRYNNYSLTIDPTILLLGVPE